MKKALCIFTLLMLALLTVQAQNITRKNGDNIQHKQIVHQHIVLEAFKLLRLAAPNLAVKLEDHIGDDFHHGELPWREQTISSNLFWCIP